MELNDCHRQLLGMRTYLNKFAIQVGYEPESDLIKALKELLDQGYVYHMDRYFNLDMGVFLDVYQLTDNGIALVEEHGIIATNP